LDLSFILEKQDKVKLLDNFKEKKKNYVIDIYLDSFKKEDDKNLEIKIRNC